MRVPTCESNISMNLGQAVAVCLYELIREKKAVREGEKVQRTTAEEQERITVILLEAMRGSGYLERRPIADVEERMRRFGAAAEFAGARCGGLVGDFAGRLFGSCGG